MKLGFLFAGQGSQHPGMGADLYAAHETFRAVLDSADVGFDLKEVSFVDSGNVLHQTAYTQPCLAAFAAGVTALLRERGIAPACVAGLSLGEYSALHAAGVLEAPDLIRLTAFRGRVMTEAAAGLDCAMVAVLGLERGALQEACRRASALGVVEIANYNCPGQMVIGGQTAAVEQAVTLAKAAGAKRCLPLRVSGPFHTSLLRPAGDALGKHFQTLRFNEPQIPVLFNCLGRESAPGDSLPALLARQVYSPVLLEDSLRRMAALGVDTILEIGPGKVLSGFVRKTAPECKTYAVETCADLDAVCAALKG